MAGEAYQPGRPCRSACRPPWHSDLSSSPRRGQTGPGRAPPPAPCRGHGSASVPAARLRRRNRRHCRQRRVVQPGDRDLVGQQPLRRDDAGHGAAMPVQRPVRQARPGRQRGRAVSFAASARRRSPSRSGRAREVRSGHDPSRADPAACWRANGRHCPAASSQPARWQGRAAGRAAILFAPFRGGGHSRRGSAAGGNRRPARQARRRRGRCLRRQSWPLRLRQAGRRARP